MGASVICYGLGMEKPQQILVTGGTGFIGSHLVRHFVSAGHTVRFLGRSLEAAQCLMLEGAQFVQGDLRHWETVLAAHEGMDWVVHSGALSSAWGRYEDFCDINVLGTEHVIKACKHHGVKRLVHISSPSVTNTFANQFNITETTPYPNKFVSMYSETKKLAEDVVEKAQENGLCAVIIRPKAVFGPGDQAIFPRLIDAARRNKLRIIGNGNTKTDVTYVDNVVHAVCLALETERANGQKYIITNDEPVVLWDLIQTLLKRLGLHLPSKKVPKAMAMRVACLLETLARATHSNKEPVLTQYKVGILAFSQTYDITKAKKELGYQPQVSVGEGLERFLSSLKETSKVCSTTSRNTPKQIQCRAFNSAWVHTRGFFIRRGMDVRRLTLPVLSFLIEHPVHGAILFDTGHTSRFFSLTQKFPERLYGWATPCTLNPAGSMVEQVQCLGLKPSNVRMVILSHLHADHVGGLLDFPKARIVVAKQALHEISRLSKWKGLFRGYLKGLLPGDLEERLQIVEDFPDAGVGPFQETLDLFGDQSIRLVPLPGHAAGQIGALVGGDTPQPFFLVGDACWLRREFEKRGPTNVVQAMLCHNKVHYEQTLDKLHQVWKNYPHWVLIPAHDPTQFPFSGGP